VINAAHTLSIASVIQYQVSLGASASRALSSITPPTIAGDDYWYDQGTPVKVLLNGIWNRSSGTGERLESFAVNGVIANTSTVDQTDALDLASISTHETVDATIAVQYQLSTPSGLIVSTTPPQISGDNGWYDSGTPVDLVYNYCWNLTANQSRTTAVAYAVDQGAATSLKRLATGTFQVHVTMTTPHSITIQSVKQYHLAVSGGNDVFLSEASPTGDAFYDSGSSITATTDYTWGVVNGDARQNLISYTLDGSSTNVTRAGSGSFATPAMTFASYHQLTFNSMTQYLVSFGFEDSSGTTTIQPPSLQIQVVGLVLMDVNGSQIWLDSGTSFQIHAVIWENANVTPITPRVYMASGPALENVPLRVYAAKITATDYLGLPISGASASVTLVNGTTIQRTTGSDGVAQLGLIPVGTFQAKLSFLGESATVAGDASAQASTPVKFLVSYPFLAILGIVIVLAVAVAVMLARGSRARAPLGLNEQFNRLGRVLASNKPR